MTTGAIARVRARVTHKGETNGFRSSKQKLVERGAFRLAHRVVANSEAVRQQLILEGVPQEKVLRHYNGLDLARVTVSGGLERKEALSMLGLPKEPARRFITVVANLQHPVKDHPTFLRAAARVRAAVPDVGFVLAGEGDLMPGLRELAAQLGLEHDVFFIGRCQNIAELLFASEVGVLSSTAEGFSNAILEYMAAGRPVVVTDVGGASEAVEEGESGYIVPSGNDEQMADRITQLLNNPEQARLMGERGRLIVEEKFSSRQQIENTIELYEELLSQSARALVSSIPGTGPQRA